MQRNMLIFTTACCFILAGINLFLNYQLYSLIMPKASEDVRAFSNDAVSIVEMEAGAETEAYVADARIYPPAAGANGKRAEDVAPLSEKTPLYLLGMKDGYITVFYGSGGGTAVKEVTALPANALPYDEKLRLSQGIPVYDEGQLAKLLQDYGS